LHGADDILQHLLFIGSIEGAGLDTSQLDLTFFGLKSFIGSSGAAGNAGSQD
jgi:hypothetical protein